MSKPPDPPERFKVGKTTFRTVWRLGDLIAAVVDTDEPPAEIESVPPEDDEPSCWN